MNLLIFDPDYKNNLTDYIKPLTDNIEGFQATLSQNFHDAKNNFMQKIYDFVIIDFTSSEGKNILKFILESRPKQKIITITYELTKSQISCKDCERLYNKRRLIKPINALDVFQTIKNFDSSSCKYANYFDSPKQFIPTLMLRYTCFKFNEVSFCIERNTNFNEHAIKEYIEIMEILDQYKIQYKFIGEFTIKIV